MPRTIDITFTLPWTLSGIRITCAALTTANRMLLRDWQRAGTPVPALYQSGVRYRLLPGPERFSWIPIVLRRKTGDCDQLACWRAAELQEQGIDAVAVPIRRRENLMHIVVKHPDGRIEDPSRVLGMGK